ncbi:MAG: outer membrane beta-barrel protein [Planctomycetota bacterium]
MIKSPCILVLFLLLPAGCASVAHPEEAIRASSPALSGAEVPPPVWPNTGHRGPRRGISSADGTVSLLFGRRSLDDEFFWSPLEEQFVFGLEAEFRFGDSPVGLELGLQPSADTATVTALGVDVDVDVVLVEAYIGPRVTLDLDEAPLSFYAGAGLNVVAASVTFEALGVGIDDDDAGTGGYAHIGALLWVGETVAVGVDVRVASGADLTLFGGSADADYKQAAAVLSFSF